MEEGVGLQCRQPWTAHACRAHRPVAFVADQDLSTRFRLLFTPDARPVLAAVLSLPKEPVPEPALVHPTALGVQRDPVGQPLPPPPGPDRLLRPGLAEAEA